ncbi:hypothetical protein Adeg_1321 [Ammonifex degensii KC4]|uniref:Uncharacterized protein n=1 Tax=Ammonifex degensii (strain DSM 10501 / KC4) TaxID=429009 RepID=C9R7Z9_AMMDK|nr:hypothetical protein [Ammonifex degensii]ACX52428.1 hypothetical protein Adeg_1321 [Ammonifex degensii KC4]
MKLVCFWPRSAWLRLAKIVLGLLLVLLAIVGTWSSFREKTCPTAGPTTLEERTGLLDWLVEKLRDYYRH